jgi:hypothetical protein
MVHSGDIIRFWRKVNISTRNECWIWNAARNRRGYGRFGFNGKNWLAARFAYLISNKELPFGMCVLHRCDNPPCVNPRHLWIGTRADNNRDCAEKGRVSLVGAEHVKHLRRIHPERFARGERAGAAKLSAVNIKEIRDRYSHGGVLQRELGEEYGVNQVTISAIVRSKSWRHLL